MKNLTELRREKCISGLRDFAEFLENNPEFPVESFAFRAIYVPCASPTELVRLTRIMGHVEKSFDGEYIECRRTFGDSEAGVALRVFLLKERMGCKKIVKGTRTIPAYTVPETVVENVEWECSDPSILAKEQERNAGLELERVVTELTE